MHVAGSGGVCIDWLTLFAEKPVQLREGDLDPILACMSSM